MDASSSDDEPRLPPNVLNSQRRGWEGESLEIEHQRESYGAGDKKSQTVAVDLSQFRNEEVGKGYQAKHVVRQREANDLSAGAGVVDMSGGAFQSEKGDIISRRDKKSKKDKKKRKRDMEKNNGQKDNRLDSYLKCQGLEIFLGEIDKMLTR